MPTCNSQTCIGHVLDVIESRARTGIKCKIGNEVMALFPRLGAMSLDSPERVKYFGLSNFHSCGICRLRKGRSVTRRSTRHDPTQISRLYEEATADVRTRTTSTDSDTKAKTVSSQGFRLREEMSFDGPRGPMSRSHPLISANSFRRLCSI